MNTESGVVLSLVGVAGKCCDLPGVWARNNAIPRREVWSNSSSTFALLWQLSVHYHWKVLRQLCDLFPRLRSARVHLQLDSGQHSNMCVFRSAVKLFGGFACRDGRRGVIHCAYTSLSPWRLSDPRAGFLIVCLRIV